MDDDRTDDHPLDWHATDAAAVADRLAVAVSLGLTEAEAKARLERLGPNRPTVRRGPGALARFLAQLLQPLILVMIVAGTVTALLAAWVDAGVIYGVVLLNAVVGFVQEGKAQSALAALVRAVATEATVLRAGRRHRVDAEILVPGDVVLLAAGDKVPADLRIVAGKGLWVAEAALTGESLPVAKETLPLPADTPVGERRNMAFAGTLIVGGQGTGIVVATGDRTQTGHISQLIAESRDLTTPLIRRINLFARRLLWLILVLAASTFLVGIARGEPVYDIFIAAVALAVGAIPEGLPAAMTVVLAIGVARMARRRAIIRKLPAVETLGSATVICSDKTGTLTENAMTVKAVWAGGHSYDVGGHGYGVEGSVELCGAATAVDGALRETLLAGVLCNDSSLVRDGRHWRITGDPTEAALLVVAHKAGLDDATLRRVFARIDEVPFESSRQYMATTHEVEGRTVAYLKGAIERLLPACATMVDPRGHEVPVDLAGIEAQAVAMAGAGLRVLALARAPSPDGRGLDAGLPAGLVFLGMVGMIDPPRRGAISAVRACHAAGIRVKMITGDHADTACAIARQLGIVGPGARALTGRELARLDDAALRTAVREVDVFARIAPEQKLRLVDALQARGEVVAMTGDGVNDAPALRRADIGIAMGLGGAEVAKEAAAMVLTDDNFATIEAAVEEGRGIYDNLMKFMVWTLPTNAGEGLVVLVAIALGVALPITPVQILWINMTTAVLLGLTLTFEPTEPGIMRRPPRPPGAPILDRPLLMRLAAVGLMMVASAFGLFLVALERGRSIEEARTIAANVFVVIEVLYLFNCRSLTASVRTVGLLSNPWIWAGVGAMVSLQLAFTYLPAFNLAFRTAPIGLWDWALIIAAAALTSAVVALEKWLRSGRGRPG